MILDQLSLLEQESIKRGIPILGREKGEWLYRKILELKPEKILELGTANGYSGCILGSLGAELFTIDLDQRLQEEAKKNFNTFKINAHIIYGDGLKEIKNFSDSTFDLIFLDFAKGKYLPILEDCIRVLKTNGFLIADNISYPKCQDYKQKVLHHPSLKTEIISIQDGMASSQKINYLSK